MIFKFCKGERLYDYQCKLDSRENCMFLKKSLGETGESIENSRSSSDL
jgi:hypothetical protein